MNRYLSQLLVVIIPSLCFAIEVENFYKLADAVANREALIELSSELFVFEETLTISHDCDIIVNPELNYVDIDLDGYQLRIKSQCQIGQENVDKRITFFNGNGNVWVHSSAAPSTVVFYYCSFNDSRAQNGLAMRVGSQRLRVDCFHCEANYNFADGYNIHNASATPGPGYLNLINSEACFNDPLRRGSPNGDGVTAHASNHDTYIHGGKYNDNGKGGATMVWGSTLVVTGNAEFMRNGAATDLGDVYIADDGVISWVDATAEEIWIRSSRMELYSGNITESLAADSGSNINIHGFAFQPDENELVYAGYFENWEPFVISLDDYETLESIYEYEVPIPGDYDNSGVINLLDLEQLVHLMFSDESNMHNFALFQRTFSLPALY